MRALFKVFNHGINPLLARLLQARPHGTLAASMAVLRYRGRRSGREITLVVQYARDESGRVLIVPGRPQDKTWWRNFTEPGPISVLAAGDEITGTARVVNDPAEREVAFRTFLARDPKAASTVKTAVIVVVEPG